MSEFFDHEAEVSEGSEDDEVREDIRRHKKAKLHKRIDDSDDEEEEDDDEAIAEEMKDLINDDVEEEEDSGDSDDEDDDEDGHDRGHKRSRDEELEEDLEDDDYDLIEENLGRRIDRKKKFRRVRRLEDDDDEDEDANNVINNREAIANELFDDDGDFGGDSGINNRNRLDKQTIEDRFGEIDSERSEDEDDNFIVDDNDRPIVNRQRSRRGGDRYTDQAMQQAQDVFGVDFDFDEVNNYDENGDFDEELDDEEYAEEGMEATDAGVSKKKKRPSRKSIFELYEPAELERSHLTSVDNDIRNRDMPERFQLRTVPVTQCDSNELHEEAQWIYHDLFEADMITLADRNPSTRRAPFGGPKSKSVVSAIFEVLNFIRNDFYEVPFIAHYRKEYFANELTIDDLWLIYRWDEKWCQLQERKRNLIKLLENMQNYQLALIVNNSDKPLPDNFRRVTEKDVRRAEAIQSFEEFNDCYLHFQLYYSSEVPEMKKFTLEQKRAKRLEQEARRSLDDPESEKAEKEHGDEADEAEEEFELSERLGFLKLAIKRDTYAICREFGIGQLAAKFGLSPEQFGEHLAEGYNKHEIKQYDLDPDEAAREQISKRFDTPEKALQAATFMVGRQISCDPLVRKTVRQIFYERAKVNVKPTKRGKKEIDESHCCFSIKYLKNKPISSFVAEQFLQLNLAKTEGLLEVNISIDEQETEPVKERNSKAPTYLDEIKYLFQRDEFSSNVQKWNEKRGEALEIALNRFLYPYLVKELTGKVLKEAQFTIIQACVKKLNSSLSMAPFTFNPDQYGAEEDDEFSTEEGSRVMGVAIMPTNEEASYCAIVNGDSEVTDFIKLEYFMLKRAEGFAQEQDKRLRYKDREKLKKFIFQKKPHVIALGCDTLVTRQVHEEITAIIAELHETEQFPRIPCEYVDSELSIVYMNSKRASSDFLTYPLKLRQAISLARRLQDPLVEFAQLCSPDEELLCLKFHPLKDNVPRDELLNCLYNEFVTRVCEVGVDINRCLTQPYFVPLVQFICGLGPRKGAYLLRTLKKQRTPLLESRTAIVSECNFGKAIFINSAGFIRVNVSSISDLAAENYGHVLDSTRIHPEAYDWARKMAVDALDLDEETVTNPAQALEDIMERPERLRDLDLDEFAKELQRQGLGLKKQTLYDIRTELSIRFQDKRRPYQGPTQEELFSLLTGETQETLHVGKLVMSRVTGIVRRRPKSEQVDQAQPIRMETGLWKCPFCMKDDFSELGEVWNHFDSNQCPGQAFGVRVRLDNGLSGMIPMKFLSDKEVTDPQSRVKTGMTVHCRILKILIDRFTVELTCRTSDLIDQHNRFKIAKDIHYDLEAEEKDIRAEQEVKKRNSRQRTYMKRIIVHPSFHNIDFRKSEQILAESNQGEAVIRPSSKGSDHLTLSWKVHDGIHQHVDIREEGKSNVFSLGKQLFIGSESFEDLDEIIARYVQPMAGYCRDLISFKYFRDLNGDRTAAENELSEEKQKAPSRIPYIVSASKEFPGKFLLSYQPNTKAFHEFITATPDGYRYRGQLFKSVNSLFKWFKVYFNDRSTFPRTPSHTTPNINPQAIQRAAASMPSHIFNTLSQVTGQTPFLNQTPTFLNQTPLSGGANNSSSNFAVPARPVVFGQPQPSPSPSPSPQINSRSFSMLPGITSMPPPPVPPVPPVHNRPGSRSGSQWAEIVQQEWQQPNTPSGRSRMKPRTPAYSTPGASSTMSISPLPDQTPNVRGDQTPLVDEWTNY